MSGHRMVRVAAVRRETDNVKSITFDDDAPVLPGQFYMVWVPGSEEVPMSVAFAGRERGISVARVGRATARLHEARPGDLLGVRGPFGKGFAPKGRTLLVGGGFGTVAVAAVPERKWGKGVKFEAVVAAKTRSELLFVKRLEGMGVKVTTGTDDGSCGMRGLATDCVRHLLAGRRFDSVLACGPERMMFALMGLCKEMKVPYQASLERYMRCGVGICDACSVSGRQVCLDGPVFSGTELARMDEFGRCKRDICGREVPL